MGASPPSHHGLTLSPSHSAHGVPTPGAPRWEFNPVQQPGEGRSCCFPDLKGNCVPGFRPGPPSRTGSGSAAAPRGLFSSSSSPGPAGAASGPFPHRHSPVPQPWILPEHPPPRLPARISRDLRNPSAAPRAPFPAWDFSLPGESLSQECPHIRTIPIPTPGASSSQEDPIPATSSSQERLHPRSILIF